MLNNLRKKAKTKKEKAQEAELQKDDSAPVAELNANSQSVVSSNSSVEEKQTAKKKKKKKSKRNPWLSLLIKLGIVAAIIFVASFFVKIEFVHSNGMFPSLRDGDLVIATNVLQYSFNDIVIYKTNTSTGKAEKHFGRVMCLEGNEVEIDDYNNFKVNGNIISTSEFYKEYEKGSIEYPYKVDENHIFILQDYRMENEDSRIYGAIDKTQIIGKVIFVFRIRGF